MIDIKNIKSKRIEFIDNYKEKYIIEKSILTGKDSISIGLEKVKPVVETTAILNGNKYLVNYPIPDNVVIDPKIYLTREQVKELIPILQKFVDTGEL